jgi:putative MATE family efflux protein
LALGSGQTGQIAYICLFRPAQAVNPFPQPTGAALTATASDLTTAPIPGLIRRLAIPASIGFFFNTMYNVVDTYFAGQLSTAALAALSLSFPVFFVLLAMGSGFATGATALIGNALGADNRREAACTASQGLLMSTLLGVVVMTVGFLAVEPLFRLLGATDAYLQICLDYMHTILLGAFLPLTGFMLNGILNSQGDMVSYRNYLIGATALNVVLDPWLMFGGLGVPAFGIRGLALATLIAQFLGVVYLAWRVRGTGLLYRSSGAVWRPHGPTLRAITGQGLPASLNMMTVALGIFIITWFLSRFSQNAVAAYGVATRIEQMVLLPTIGLNVATMSLVAQNAGAGRFGRVRAIVRKALSYGAVVMVFGSALVWFSSDFLMGLFTDDPAVIGIGGHYLRIAAFVEYAYVLLFVNTSALQGLKMPAFALWIGLYRQLAAPMVIFWLTTRVFGWGLNGIWWGVFGVTWSAALLAVWYARRQVDRLAGQEATPAGLAAQPEA